MMQPSFNLKPLFRTELCFVMPWLVSNTANRRPCLQEAYHYNFFCFKLKLLGFCLYASKLLG